MTDSLPTGTPDEGESRDQRWIGLDELQSLTSSEIYPNVREIVTFVLTDILGAWEVVELSDFES